MMKETPILALPKPEYSSIAAKLPEPEVSMEQQQQPAEVLPAHGVHETLVVSIEEEKVECKTDTEGFTPVQSKKTRKSSSNSFTKPTNQTISDDWMIDDVGAIESSDDEECIKKKETPMLALPKPEYSSIAAKLPEPEVSMEQLQQPAEVLPVHGVHQTLVVSNEEEKVECKTDAEGFTHVLSKKIRERSSNSCTKPTKPTISDDWMIDNVGAIESSDDEQSIKIKERPVLALPKPEYSSIAANLPEPEVSMEQQQQPTEVLLAHGVHETLVVSIE